MKLECIERITSEPVGAVVIWLHGLGADGTDFLSAVEYLDPGSDKGVKFVFPHAPVRPVTLSGGQMMRAWYDVRSLDMDGAGDVEQLNAARRQIEDLIQDQTDAGIAPEQIVLAGFSQGGALALYTALRYHQKLAGIIGLSTYLPMPRKLADEIHAENRKTPIFLAHGARDPVIPIVAGEYGRDTLVYYGCPVSWNRYPIEHSVNIDELNDIKSWLKLNLDF